MEDLYESTHETVHLGMLDGIEVIYVDKIAGHRGVSVPTSVGRRMPAHCTGLGKAILAFSDPELTNRVISAGLRRARPTRLSCPMCCGRVGRARIRGVAYDREESVLGVACAAAPIRGQDGTLSWRSR